MSNHPAPYRSRTDQAVLGALTGVAFGLLASYLVGRFSQPTIVSIQSLFVAVGFACATGLFFGVSMVEARVSLAAKIDEAVALGATDALRHLVEGFIERVDVYTGPSPLTGKGRGGRAERWKNRPAPRVVITPTDAVDVGAVEEMCEAADECPNRTA